MFFLFLSCSEDVQTYRDSCQLAISIPESDTQVSPNESSSTDTSIPETLWRSGDMVQISVQPLSSIFDTLVLLNGQRLVSDETWELYRNDCSDCDSCQATYDCLTCSDCDYCHLECSSCQEGISFQLPLIQEALYTLQVKNAFGESPLLNIYISDQSIEE
jgi:hypothetical protein